MTKPEPIDRDDPPIERITDTPRQIPLDAATITAALAEVGRQLRAAFTPPRPATHEDILAAVHREVTALAARTNTPQRLLSGRHTYKVGVDPTRHKADSVAAAALAWDAIKNTGPTPATHIDVDPARDGSTVISVYANGEQVDLDPPVPFHAGDSISVSLQRIGDRLVPHVEVTPPEVDPPAPAPRKLKAKAELRAELQRVRNQVTELEAQLLVARARNARLSTRLDRSARRLNHALDAAERRIPAPGPATGSGPYRPACGSLVEHGPHPIGADGRYCYGCHDYGAPNDPQIRVEPAGAPRYRMKDNPQA